MTGRELYRTALLCACFLMVGEVAKVRQENRELLLREAAQRGCEDFYADQIRSAHRLADEGAKP